MKIETKFNIGDKVYYFIGESVCKDIITDIEIKVLTTHAITDLKKERYCVSENIFIGYEIKNSDVNKGENELFTKEETERKLNEIYINKIKELD